MISNVEIYILKIPGSGPGLGLFTWAGPALGPYKPNTRAGLGLGFSGRARAGFGLWVHPSLGWVSYLPGVSRAGNFCAHGARAKVTCQLPAIAQKHSAHRHMRLQRVHYSILCDLWDIPLPLSNFFFKKIPTIAYREANLPHVFNAS